MQSLTESYQPHQFSFAAKSPGDLAIDRAKDVERIPVWGPPPDDEMNRLSTPSTDLRVEARGDGVFRFLAVGWWADFLTTHVGGKWSASYVAGNVDAQNIAAFEDLAARTIEREF